MPKSKYYRLLGLSPNASEKEIRKKFRALALKVHPDHNNSHSAEEEFILLTEAHDMLLGKNSLTNKNTKTKGSNEEERLKRVAEARRIFKEQLVRNHLENEIYFKKLTTGNKWRLIKVSALIGLLLSILLILDIFLPHHYQKQEIVEYKRYFAYSSNGEKISLIKTNTENYFWVSKINFSMHDRYRNILVESSWFFHNSIRLISREDGKSKYFDIHFSFYSATWILLILFLTPSFTLWHKRKKISFTVLFHFCYYGVNGLMVFYLITDDRWAHVLTLGYY